MTAADSTNFQGAVVAEDAELTQFVQTLTKDMQNKFTGLLDSVLGKVEEMTCRIEQLEKNVNELIVASSQE